MSITDPSAIYMAVPDYEVDNIIGTNYGSFSIAPASNASTSFTTGFGSTCLFVGVYSVDGGTTWNDFGEYVYYPTNSYNPSSAQITCQGWIAPTGIFTAYGTNYNSSSGSGSTYTIDYRVVFFAEQNQGSITPITDNQILRYNSGFNYLKISQQGSFTEESPYSITHNLGYVPVVRAWISSSDPSYYGWQGAANSILSYDWATSGESNIEVTSTTLNFDNNFNSSAPVTTYYRIYLDT